MIAIKFENASSFNLAFDNTRMTTQTPAADIAVLAWHLLTDDHHAHERKGEKPELAGEFKSDSGSMEWYWSGLKRPKDQTILAGLFLLNLAWKGWSNLPNAAPQTPNPRLYLPGNPNMN